MYDELVKRCNEFVWGYCGQVAFASPQHRNTVRTYFAGALEALKVCGAQCSERDHDRVLNEITKMAEEDWVPGPEFMPPPNRQSK
jgi:hypothetical protein